LVWRAGGSRVRAEKGAIATLYTCPPEGSVSVVVCVDEMGPEAAKSWPGKRVLYTAPSEQPRRPAGRARQEIDDGRRESGYVFGAFQPATGEAFTAPYARRTAVNWADFLAHVEAWVDPRVMRVYAGVCGCMRVYAGVCGCMRSWTT
jgi:hypothetical protein